MPQATGLATASYRNRGARRGSPLPQLHSALSRPQEWLTLQNSLGLPVCDFQGLCWCMVSKGGIWYQSNEVSATKGKGVTRRACQCSSAACSPQAVQPCVRCHAGIPRRADAHLSKASSPPRRRGRLSQEGRQKGESVCRNAQNGPTTARFSELELQMASAVLPMF